MIYYPLTEPQKRIYTVQNMHLGSSMFQIGGFVKLYGQIDMKRLEEAIVKFIYGTDTFQIRLTQDQQHRPVQYFTDPPRDLVLDIHYLETDSAFEEWVLLCSKEPMDITGPLYKFSLFRLSSGICGYAVKIHHIIADGWSMQLLSNRISALYQDFNCIEENSVFPSYLNYILDQRSYFQSDQYLRDKDFWSKQFEGFSVAGHSWSPSVEGRRKTWKLSDRLSDDIRRFCKENTITLNTLFIGLYLVLQYKYTGESKLTIGLPLLGRRNRSERNTFGMFVNTIPFFWDIDTHMTFTDMLTEIAKQLKLCYAHQKFPYSEMIKDLNAWSAPVFNTCINYYHTHMCRQYGELSAETYEFYNGQQDYDLQWIIREWSDNGTIQLEADYKISVYREDEIEAMYRCFEQLCHDTSHNASRNVEQICLLAPEELKQLVFDYNKQEFHAESKTVAELIKKQIELTPSRLAIGHNGREYTYRQLNELSDSIASVMIKNGVSAGEIVGVFASHSIELVAGILAIWKVNAAYLPFDPQTPYKRVQEILGKASVSFLLVDDIRNTIVEDKSIHVINLQQLPSVTKIDIPIIQPSGTDLAYCIFTSGSTGAPKGVQVEHHSLSMYIQWAASKYLHNRDDVFALYSSISFDLTVTSLFTPLICGGKIQIYEDDANHHAIYRICEENKCTVLKLTPSHLKLLNQFDNRSSIIHTLIVGGENLPVELTYDTEQSFRGRATIFNEYGPTEATVGCMTHRYDPSETIGGYVPIGVPSAKNQIYLLDSTMQPVPAGMPGEIYISGDGLARGYFADEKTTEQRFLFCPFNKRRMYKTGDKAYFDSKNRLVFYGRTDDQIKIRGYRVEPAEIQACVLQFPGIKDCIATVKKVGGTDAICCYYVSNQPLDENILRDYLSDYLPAYLIPQWFVKISAMPFTKNGKTDKESLPLPQNYFQDNIYSGTEDDKEFLSIFQTILRRDDIHMQDNFFIQGGDSIKAIQVSAAFDEKEITLPVKIIMQSRNFYEIHQYITHRKQVQKKTSSVITMEQIPHTPILAWFNHLDLPNQNCYCQAVALQMIQPPPDHVLESMLRYLIACHDSLRIKKSLHGEYTYVPFSDNVFVLNCQTSDSCEDNSCDRIIGQLIEQVDLKSGRLLKASLYHKPQEVVLYIVIHHVAVDGVSWNILLMDLQRLLKQWNKGEVFSLIHNGSSYQSWALSQRTIKKIVSDTNSLIPTEKCIFETKVLDELITKRVFNDVVFPNHAKPIELLLTAFCMTVRSLGDRINEDIQIEYERHGRSLEEAFSNEIQTVGWFTQICRLTSSIEFADSNSNLRTYFRKIKALYEASEQFGDFTGGWNPTAARLNFLGDIRTDYNDFHLIPLYSFERVSCLMEVDALLIEDSLHITLRLPERLSGQLHFTLHQLCENLEKIVDYYTNNGESLLSIDDFKEVNLSDSEFESLFI